MAEKLPEVIDLLLRYRESSNKDTRLFRRLRHNDHLCPAVERQANEIINCYSKFHSIAYDVQGLNDRGTDVLVRYNNESELGESDKYIAFQIKSFDDLNSKTYLRELKAQRFEAQTEYGKSLDHYYILVCTDKLVHENKIRQIKKSFGSLTDVTVIDPSYAWTFIRLNPLRINAIVDSILREDDFVLGKVRRIIEGLTPTEMSILFSIVYELTVNPSNTISREAVQQRIFVKEIYDRVPDYPRGYFFFSEDISDYEDDEGEVEQEDIRDIERTYGVNWINGKFKPPEDQKRDALIRFAEDFDFLEGNSLSLLGSGGIEVNPEYAFPIKAILLDAMVRYGYDSDELLEYIFNALGVLDQLGI